MYLVRVAVLRLGEQLGELFSLQLRRGETIVETGPPIRVEGKPAGHLLIAVTPLADALAEEGGEVALPMEEIHEAQEAIEALAGLVALERRSSHSLASPLPFVGVISRETESLQALIGLRTSQPMVHSSGPTGSGPVGILDDEILAALGDRMDGVSLLASALSQVSSTAQQSRPALKAAT